MKTSSIVYSKDTLLSEMDAATLVSTYATKLTLLTKKQRVIFDLLSSGMMIKDIAKHLELADITVKVVKARIMVLLSASTLQDLAIIGKCSQCKYIKHEI